MFSHFVITQLQFNTWSFVAVGLTLPTSALTTIPTPSYGRKRKFSLLYVIQSNFLFPPQPLLSSPSFFAANSIAFLSSLHQQRRGEERKRKKERTTLVPQSKKARAKKKKTHPTHPRQIRKKESCGKQEQIERDGSQKLPTNLESHFSFVTRIKSYKNNSEAFLDRVGVSGI